MISIHIRRAIAIVALVAASSILPAPNLHARPRERPKPTSDRRVLWQSHPVWRFLMSLWEENGLRIDDNG